MSSLTDTLIQAADMASTVKAGLQVIEKITGSTKGDKAIEALALVGQVASALHKGLAGELHAEDVLRELDKLKTGLAADDAQAESELDKKFPTG